MARRAFELPRTPEAVRLRVFLTYAVFGSVIGALLVLYLALTYRHIGLGLLGLLLVASVAILLWAWRQTGHGTVERAAIATCVPLWALAVFLALFVDIPLLNFSLLLVLSVMAALSYVSQQQLQRIIRAVTVMAIMLTPVALMVRAFEPMPFALKGQIVPPWVLTTILVTILPLIIGLILLLLWQYGAQLAEALARLRASNAALRESERQLAAKVRELEESRRRIVQVQEGVRQEIASYLHGRVQARLLVLKSRLQEPLRETDSVTATTGHVLRQVIEQMDNIVEEDLSGLSRRLYPAILRRGLVPALQSLADHFEHSLPVALELDEQLACLERADRNAIPEPVRLAAYRIAEEALANVVKHARATQVTLRLGLPVEGGLRLTVADDAQGFDCLAASAGLGLTAMQDYAAAAGGDCAVQSAPGKGTHVTVTLPWVLNVDSRTPADR